MNRNQVIALAFALLLVPVVLGQTTTQDQKLTASDAAAGDAFGFRVAMDGTSAVISAKLENSGNGAVYVFTQSGSSWSQQQKLTASDAQTNDQFGTSVDIDGDTVIVGAEFEDTGDINAGAAYVFTRSGGSWSQQQKLTSPAPTAGGGFGYSVAVSGDNVVVGARGQDNPGTDAGAAYVFTRSGSTWTLLQEVTPSDRQAGDFVGTSVDIDGDSLIVGASREDAAGSNAGAAYVFTRSGGSWSQQQKLTANDATAGDEFGAFAAISGDSVIVGAPLDESSAGAAYVFTRSGGSWSQQQKLTASDAQANDQFGQPVALDGDIVVAGARREDAGGSNAGAAYWFSRNGGTWTQHQKLTASDAQANDQLGAGVALAGSTSIVGADHSGVGTAAAYVYSLIAVEGPSGLRGTADGSGGILVEFSLSPADLDNNGGFTYELERDVGGGFSIIHTTTDGDATDRVFSYLDGTAPSGLNDATYRVRVMDAIAGGSAYSCTITVDVDVEADQDTCGDLAPSGTGGDFFGPGGIFYGGDKSSYAETWKLTEDGLDALYGVGMVLFFAGLAFVMTRSPGIAGLGGAAGVVFALVFGLFPLWVIFFLVILTAALFFLLRGGGD